MLLMDVYRTAWRNTRLLNRYLISDETPIDNTCTIAAIQDCICAYVETLHESSLLTTRTRELLLSSAYILEDVIVTRYGDLTPRYSRDMLSSYIGLTTALERCIQIEVYPHDRAMLERVLHNLSELLEQ